MLCRCALSFICEYGVGKERVPVPADRLLVPPLQPQLHRPNSREWRLLFRLYWSVPEAFYLPLFRLVMLELLDLRRILASPEISFITRMSNCHFSGILGRILILCILQSYNLLHLLYSR